MGFACFDLRGELCIAHLDGLYYLLVLIEAVGKVQVSDQDLHSISLHANFNSIKGQMAVHNIIVMHLFDPLCDVLNQEDYLFVGPFEPLLAPHMFE